jgi:hypothetical protein
VTSVCRKHPYVGDILNEFREYNEASHGLRLSLVVVSAALAHYKHTGVGEILIHLTNFDMYGGVTSAVLQQ